MHSEEPGAAAQRPAAQARHVLADVAPVAVLLVPTGHSAQPLARDEFPYVPGMHAVQLPEPAEEKVPRTQSKHTELSSARAVAPAVPAGHFVQDKTPNWELKEPGAHPVHVPFGRMYSPAPQLEQIVDPAMLKKPDAQQAPAPTTSASSPGAHA